MLYPGEAGVCADPVYAWVPPQQIPGTLYLTNLRLVFESGVVHRQEYGFDDVLGISSQVAPPMLNLEVRQITNVSAVDAPNGWHTLRVEASGGAFVYHFQTPRAHEWVKSIQQARGQSPLPSGAPPTPASGFPPPSPPPAAAPSPPPAASPATGGTVYCMKCGKPNVTGGGRCVGCGAVLQ
jgi:hypothetical protein